MKENNLLHGNNTPEEVWTSIITCLKGAEEAGTWAFWRERFSTNHPQHNEEEIDNPAQFAYANWHAAKYLYCLHKDEMDSLYNKYQQEKIVNWQHLDLFKAMAKVCKEEVAEQLEQHILKEKQVEQQSDFDDIHERSPQEGIWEEDEFLPDPDSEFVDEDDLYDDEDDEEYLDEEDEDIDD